ncbi:MAG TPA: hypothetical protein VM935_08315 [Chitinophagaceae bacterium]|nr:hypothetical protein [Chitinophagaceae bacterium]
MGWSTKVLPQSVTEGLVTTPAHILLSAAKESKEEAAFVHLMPNAGHVDLYDKVELISFDRLEAFFKKHLNENGGN